MSDASKERVRARRWPEPAMPEWLRNWLALHSFRAGWNTKWQRWEIAGYSNGARTKIYATTTTPVDAFLHKTQYILGEK